MTENAFEVPFSREAERSVVGACLWRPEVLDDVIDIVAPADFHDPVLGEIFRATCECSNEQTPISAVSVHERLRSGARVKDGSDIDAMLTLVDEVATTANVKHYANIIRDKAKSRNLMLVLQNAMYDLSAHSDSTAVLESLDAELAKLAQGARSGALSAADLALKAMEYIEGFTSGTKKGIPTGLDRLDWMLGGWHPKDLVIVAGRPGMGKSALMEMMAVHAAKSGYPTLICESEMTDTRLATRSLSRLSGVPVQFGRKLSDQEVKRLAIAASSYGGLPIRIEDSGVNSIPEIMSATSRAIRQMGCKMACLDHLQRMRSHTGRKTDTEIVGEVVRGAKMMASDLGIPVILLSQLNRDLEKRQDKRPVIGDLANSGAIEQEADVIGFVYRDGAYEEGQDNKPGPASFIVRKARSGPIGTVPMYWEPSLTQFTEVSNRVPEEYGQTEEY